MIDAQIDDCLPNGHLHELFAWLMSEYAEKQLAPKTVSRYRQFLKRILPELGHVRLENLQPLHLIEFYNKLADEGSWKEKAWVARPSLLEKYKVEEHKITLLAKEAKLGSATIQAVLDRKPVTHETASRICTVMSMPLNRGFLEQQTSKHLGQRTIKHHHTLISSMLSTAVDWQIIHDNPAKRVKAPKAPRLEAKYLDEYQTADLLDKLENEPIKYKAMIKLLLYSGMRRGELLGLEWDDICWEKSTIRIQRSSQYVVGKGVFTKETMTKTSDRTIRLPEAAFDILKTYRAWQNEERLKLGDYWQPSNRLFTAIDEKAIHPDTITGWFSKFIDRNDLPKVTIHSLRHTNVTLLIMAGVPLRTVAKRVGHSSSVTTSLIYSHAIQSADEMASEMLDDVLKPIKAAK